MRDRVAGLVLALVAMAAGFSPPARAAPTQQGPQNGEAPGSNRRVEFAAPGGTPLALDIFYPALDGTPRPAIILIHGGGWRREGRSQLAPFAERLRDRFGVVVATIDYRLDVFPSGFPAEVDDVDAAIAWMRGSAAGWDVDPERIALVGSSAGANLALVAGLRETGPERVAAIVSFSAPVDLVELSAVADAGQTEEYLGCDPASCPDLYDAASPLAYVSDDDPPVLVVNSVDDRVPADQASVLDDALRAAGVSSELVVVDGDGHGHSLADDVEAELGDFLSRTLQVEALPSAPTTTTGLGTETTESTAAGETTVTSASTKPTDGATAAADAPGATASRGRGDRSTTVTAFGLAAVVAGATILGLRRRRLRTPDRS